MARKIIILDVAKQASGSFEVSAVFWLTAPANRIVPRPGAASAVPGATALELTAIQAGTVVEQSNATGAFPTGTNAATARAELVSRYNAQQAALDASAAGADFIGDFWDGTTWTVG